MKYIWYFCFLMFFTSGCVAINRPAAGVNGTIEPTVVFRPGGSTYILSCLEETKKLSRKTFNDHFRVVSGRVKQQGTTDDTFRLICLSLNGYADYKQFREGAGLLDQYIKRSPENSEDLEGLRFLVDRINLAKKESWKKQKLLDGKMSLEAVLAELEQKNDELERQCRLEKAEAKKMHALDTRKIQELRDQIEQLKNIENIIKNREHSS